MSSLFTSGALQGRIYRRIRLQTKQVESGTSWSSSAGDVRAIVETQTGSIGADIVELAGGQYQTTCDRQTYPTLGGALWFAVQAQNRSAQ